MLIIIIIIIIINVHNRFILYGCETWTLTLREKKRLRVFENKLNDLHGKPDIIRTIKSHTLRWVGHLPRMKWENNINYDLREEDYTLDDWKTLPQDRDVWRAYVLTAMNLPFNIFNLHIRPIPV
ncbi:hypothetical protein C0J52_06974 [Blattella germanica]|nr:hypothetical protein C0J52_06974 [Blattella germanica]